MTTHGKYRHLSRCSTADGRFVILAIDHRANLRSALEQARGATISDADFTAFKQTILRAGAPYASAVLTDPAYGIGAGIASRTIPGSVGLLAPLEVTNYDVHPDQRDPVFIPGWSVEQIKRAGGDGVKLLLYYHPEAASAAARIDTVARIVAECTQHDIPLFLEPITYSLRSSRGLTNTELTQITVEMVRLFGGMGVDVLKLHFPVDPAQSDDDSEWRAACEQVNAACSVPWTLLSAGATFEVFARQARIACAAGASGVIVGRAVWNEAVGLDGEALLDFANGVMRERLQTLNAICAESARAWMARVSPPDESMNWFV